MHAFGLTWNVDFDWLKSRFRTVIPCSNINISFGDSQPVIIILRVKPNLKIKFGIKVISNKVKHFVGFVLNALVQKFHKYKQAICKRLYTLVYLIINFSEKMYNLYEILLHRKTYWGMIQSLTVMFTFTHIICKRHGNKDFKLKTSNKSV